MFNTLGIKSDYSILKSLIKITDLVSFCIENKITYAGIVDDNLFYVMEFYDLCKKNNKMQKSNKNNIYVLQATHLRKFPPQEYFQPSLCILYYADTLTLALHTEDDKS